MASRVVTKVYAHGKAVSWRKYDKCQIETVYHVNANGSVPGLEAGRFGGLSPRKLGPSQVPKSMNGVSRVFSTRAADKLRGRLAIASNPLFCRDRVALFYTFTVPHGLMKSPQEDHPVILQQFRKLLENLRRRHGLVDYSWTAEAQKNGQIHFHAVLFQDKGRYLPVRGVNFYWCRLLAELGINVITPEYRRKCQFESKYEPFAMIVMRPSAFVEWHKNSEPMANSFPDHWLGSVYPCVDAKRIGSFSQLSKYLSKYVTKENAPVYCTKWYQSRRIVALVGFVEVVDSLSRLDCYTQKTYVREMGASAFVRVDFLDVGVLRSTQFIDVFRGFQRLARNAAAMDRSA